MAKAKTVNKSVAKKTATKTPLKVASKSAAAPAKTAKLAAKAVVKSVAKPAAKSAAKSTAKAPAKSAVLVAPKSVAKAPVAAPLKTQPKVAAKAPAKVASKASGTVGAKASAPVKKSHLPSAPSSKMTLMKLGFSSKEQAAIVAAPHGFKVPDSVDEPATLDAQYDFILIFVENLTEAEVICASLCPSIRNKGRAWVAWPKGGASDIQLDQLSGMVEAEGLVTVTHLSLDEKWSAAKFMHPKAER